MLAIEISTLQGRTPTSAARSGPRVSGPTLLRLALLVVVGLVAFGCSGDDAAEVATDGAVERVESEAPAADGGGEQGADAEAPGDAPQAGSSDELRPISATLGRRVIRTAEIELEVDDPDTASDEVMALADRAGGFVATTDLHRDAEELLRGTITLRVPADDLLRVLSDLEDLAVSTPVSRIDERDVTTQTADLEARRTNLTAYEQELTALLGDVRESTSSPDDLLRIFERIREVRAEIDQIEGRLASLSDQVELATVTVRLTPASTALPVSDPTWQPGDTLHDAMAAAARGLSLIVDGAIWLGVAVLPVVLVGLLPVIVLVLAWRRWRREPGPAAPSGSATPTG